MWISMLSIAGQAGSTSHRVMNLRMAAAFKVLKLQRSVTLLPGTPCYACFLANVPLIS